MAQQLDFHRASLAATVWSTEQKKKIRSAKNILWDRCFTSYVRLSRNVEIIQLNLNVIILVVEPGLVPEPVIG
jgi:hypothetical protein